jgi:hypothetical protein
MHLLGFSFFEPIRLNRRFIVLFVMFVFGLFYCGYSVVVEWPDVERMLQVTMTLTIAVQVSLRFVCYLFDRSKCLEIRKRVVKFYENCDELDEKFRKTLAKNIQKLKIVFVVVFISHFICEFTPYGMSLFNFLVKGKTVPPLPCFLPYLDRNSPISFWINFLMQLIMAVMLIMANPEADCTYIMIVTQSKAYVDLIQRNLNELSSFVEMRKEVKSKNLEDHERKIKQRLIKLIKSHCEIVDYFRLASSFISKHFFILICLNIYVICSSGISFLTSEYSVSLGIAVLYPMQIFFVCILGEFFKYQHERLNDLLWKFDWHKLSINHQKIYNFIQLNVQHPMRLEIMFIGVIDLKLYINVTRHDLVETV